MNLRRLRGGTRPRFELQARWVAQSKVLSYGSSQCWGCTFLWLWDRVLWTARLTDWLGLGSIFFRVLSIELSKSWYSRLESRRDPVFSSYWLGVGCGWAGGVGPGVKILNSVGSSESDFGRFVWVLEELRRWSMCWWGGTICVCSNRKGSCCWGKERVAGGAGRGRRRWEEGVVRWDWPGPSWRWHMAMGRRF